MNGDGFRRPRTIVFLIILIGILVAVAFFSIELTGFYGSELVQNHSFEAPPFGPTPGETVTQGYKLLCGGSSSLANWQVSKQGVTIQDCANANDAVVWATTPNGNPQVPDSNIAAQDGTHFLDLTAFASKPPTQFGKVQQEVQGTAALAFVRQRHGLPEGDLDRVRRQQAFLSGAADKILSVGTLTNPSKLSDLVDAINRSVVFDKGFSVLTFAEQITNLSSGNITFETLPTTGPESSTDKDALATDPAALKAFFAGITGGTSATTPAPQAPVDPASITVDLQDGTIADGVTSFAAETINTAGFKLGSLGVVAGTKAGNEQATTEVHYPPDASGTAQQVAAAFGIGQLVEDDAIKSGHVLLVVGTDLDTSGAPASDTPAATAAPAAGDTPAAAAPTDAVTAGSVRCVN